MIQTDSADESNHEENSVFFTPWWIFLYIVVTYVLIELFWCWYVNCCVSPGIQHPRPGQEHIFKNPIELIEEYFTVMKKMGNTYTFQKWISGWFHNADFNEIYAENIEAALAWAVYTSHLENLEIEQRAELLRLRKLAETTFDIKPRDGFNENLRLRHACMDLEPVTFINKPLILYGLLNLAHALECWTLRGRGFQRYTTSHGIKYWFKEEPGLKTRMRSRYSSRESLQSIDTDGSNLDDNHYGALNDQCSKASSLLSTLSSPQKSHFKGKLRKEEPIFIFHGITRGFGYLMPMIDQFRDRAIILLEYPCIWFSWITLHVDQCDEICDAFSETLDAHDIHTVSIVGHSWGTFQTGWIVRRKPELISQIVFCDPISMCVWLPDTTYTILYKPPVKSSEYMLCYFVRNDITVSHTLHRNFAWYNMSINLDEVPLDIGIIIVNSGNDDMIHPGAAEKLIEIHRSKILESSRKLFLKHLYHENFEHGKAASDPTALQAMKQAMIDNEEDMKRHGVYRSKNRLDKCSYISVDDLRVYQL